jgi:protein SCO1/2
MTTKLISLVALLMLAPGARATETPPKPPCCAPEKPACCAEQIVAALPALPAKPLAARSIYQLDATWTNDAGARVQLASLRGQPVVIAMFFASCEYACPLLVTDLLRLREALPAEARAKTRFVLVTFDTARDTPAALKAYRERMQLDAAWTLLRGEEANVQALAMLLGVKFKQDARGQFSHSNLFTVLNTEGEIAHQRAGLGGDVSEAARVLAIAAK